MSLTPDEKQQAAYYVSELETPTRPLTTWELGFLESMDDKITRDQDLTQLEFDKLKEIYEEKV